MKLQIAAVGDLLVRETISESVRVSDKDDYQFEPVFAPVASILQKADLTIGNLEVPLAGREKRYMKRNPKNRYPQFNCPDELAPALRQAGFDVLTTANNHCLDRGTAGLIRTLKVLDKHNLKHTGTYATRSDSLKPLIIPVKGIRIGIISCTRGTNSQPCPNSWMVNRLHPGRIRSELNKLRSVTDFCIVCMHHGPEYSHTPTKGQKQWAKRLLAWGADLVLGSHPHVVQPVLFTKSQKAVIYSLGSLISSRLKKDPRTLAGTILLIDLVKTGARRARIQQIVPVPTWVRTIEKERKKIYQVVPLEATLDNPDAITDVRERKQMETMLRSTLTVLGLQENNSNPIK